SISECRPSDLVSLFLFFFQAEDGIRDPLVTGVQTCALPISPSRNAAYSAAGSSPKRRGNTTPRSAACTAPRAARCECSAVSSIAPAAMRRPLRLDKRPTAGDAAPVSWRDRHRARLATAPEALGAGRPGDTVAGASFSTTPPAARTGPA